MNSRTSRSIAPLPQSVQQKLDMYALAASSARVGFFEKNCTGAAALAAGAGMLMFLPSAQAKIVYTPAHVHIGEMHILDLNHDGKSDFFLYHQPYHSTTRGKSYYESGLWVVGVETTNHQANGVVGNRLPHGWATPLPPGARIDAKDPLYGGNMAFTRESSHGKETTTGPWLNGGKGVKNRYLGLNFFIDGKAHYGWARLTVTLPSYIDATLTGYAYETIPNKPIITGKTKGPDVITVHPDIAAGSLGRLAAGASRNRK